MSNTLDVQAGEWPFGVVYGLPDELRVGVVPVPMKEGSKKRCVVSEFAEYEDDSMKMNGKKGKESREHSTQTRRAANSFIQLT